MNLFEFETTAEGIAAEGGGAKPAEGGEAAKPEWLEDRYSSVEDQAKAYSEARKEMDRLRTEMEQQGRQFSEALQEMTAETQRQSAQKYDPNADPDVTAWRQAVEAGDPDMMLGANLKLVQRLVASEREQAQKELQPQIDQQAQLAQDAAIELAEATVRTELIQKGLDYDASREEIADQIKAFGGLPVGGNKQAHEAMIRAAGEVVYARAVTEAHSKGEFLRREKLAAGTVQPGATGRTATGAPAEKDAWSEIRGADDNSYAGLMGRSQR